MKIRPYNNNDFITVSELLTKHGVNPPKEQSDLGGLCLVAERDGVIVGVIWALCNQFCSMAYIGYLAVESHFIAYRLMENLFTLLRCQGVNKYFFRTRMKNLKKIAMKLGCYKEQDTEVFYGEL